MRLRSLNQLDGIRLPLLAARRRWLRARYGVRVPASSSVSFTATLAARDGAEIVIGEETLIAFHARLDTWDMQARRHRSIRIGSYCFVGGGSLIAAGVTIGDRSIVAAGAVVLADVPPRSIVAGNPARIVRRDIQVGNKGRLLGADDNSRRLWKPG